MSIRAKLTIVTLVLILISLAINLTNQRPAQGLTACDQAYVGWWFGAAGLITSVPTTQPWLVGLAAAGYMYGSYQYLDACLPQPTYGGWGSGGGGGGAW